MSIRLLPCELISHTTVEPRKEGRKKNGSGFSPNYECATGFRWSGILKSHVFEMPDVRKGAVILGRAEDERNV